MKARPRFIFAVFILLCVALPTLAQPDAFDSDAEQQFLTLINQERSKRGIPELKLDDRLTAAARQHSTLLAKNHQLSHQFTGEPNLPKRLAATGLRFNSDAENVAFDQSVENAHAGLMLSPPHRANILNPDYNAIGIGLVRTGDLLFVTEDFAHRLDFYTDSQAEDRIATAFEHINPAQPVKRVSDDRLRPMACDMAKSGEVDTRKPLTLPHVFAAVAFTDSIPDQLPSSAVKIRNERNVKSYAVGACFAASPNYPSGVYWVVMVFY